MSLKSRIVRSVLSALLKRYPHQYLDVVCGDKYHIQRNPTPKRFRKPVGTAHTTSMAWGDAQKGVQA